jgi:nitrite reductase/ring-hydroxylating ferredoxin subunit
VDADGGVTCLAHRFCYDLATGECRNARDDRIRTERIE